MRDIKTVIVLSVVAIVLALGLGVCIAIKPLSVIGFVPMLTVIALIIGVIGGKPIESDRSAEPINSANQGHVPQGEFSQPLEHDSYTIAETGETVRGGPQLPQGSPAKPEDFAAVLEWLGIEDLALALEAVSTQPGRK